VDEKPSDARDRADEHLSIGQLLLAAIGAASTGLDAVDEIADDLAGRLGIDRTKVRGAVRDTLGSWRQEADRLGGRREDALERGLERLGVVRRSEVDDLLLRVAQLEHRLRLLERDNPTVE
jgi:polyhydroxyalkanoate synthesis regulator phasin